MCPCCVVCLCWQPCLPCPSWCSSSQAMARLGSGAHTQWGEYQHAQEWELLLLSLWSCGRNGAKRAQQSWHRLGGHAWLPQTLLQALWERWPCAGVLPGIGHGTVRAVLAQLLQLGSALAELGELWPPMTRHLPLLTARVSFLMPL